MRGAAEQYCKHSSGRIYFYSRASCEARREHCSRTSEHSHFYSRASCEARPICFLEFSLKILISTHAPHARRGILRAASENGVKNFYSRASCEARPEMDVRIELSVDFYSRASCEARRPCSPRQGSSPGDFYSRASCEARPVVVEFYSLPLKFLLTRLMRGAALQALKMS